MICCAKRSGSLLMLFAFLCLPALVLAGSGMEDLQVEAKTDFMFESFEGPAFEPIGWHKIHLGSTYTWSKTSAGSQSGTYCAYVRNGYNGQPQDEYLVTAALDLTYTLNPKLGWYEEEVNWSTRGGTHYIMVSTTSQTDPAAFEVVSEMTPANHTVAGFGAAMVEVDLSAYAGQSQVYVAFRYVGEYSDYWFIDDVKVFELVGAGGDVTPSAINPMDVSFNNGDVFTPSADIYNNGANAADLDVEMKIFESGTEVYSEVLEMTNLPSDQTQTINFPDFTVTGGHLIELRCTTMMDGDEIPANDTRTVYNTAYTQPHIPMGLLFTNAGCDPCVPANQTLDAYIPTQGNDVSLARVHVSWPGSDIMYNANVAQSNAMISDYGVNSVPTMFIDGMDAGYSGNFVAMYTARKAIKSPMNIELAFDDAADQLTVKVNILEMMMPVENFKLRAFVTEDNVYYAGGNGETRHYQAMRHIWNDTNGLDCPTTLGTHTFVIDTPLDGGWVYNNLRATVYLQDMDSRIMMQSATDFLTNIEEDVSAVGDQVTSAYKLNANYPNPFNPSTTISFRLPREEQVEVAVYSIDGSRVATLLSEMMSQGDHQVVWMGKDSSGAPVASGAYFYRLMTPSFSETRVMTLVK
jgi:glutaredoxin